MKSLFIIFILATVILASPSGNFDVAAAQNSFCDVCSKGWQDKLPKSWAEVTGYLNLACFQLDSSLKPTCMALIHSLPLGDIYNNFRPKFVNFGEAVCGKYC